jgi:hypothetical protein
MAGMRFLVPVGLVLSILLVPQTGSHAFVRGDPAVSLQGPQITRDIVTFSKRYWARVSGRDNGKGPHVNGHDEFAAAWQKQVMAALHGLPAGNFTQRFRVPGFVNIPATSPGLNVLVVVPGTVHPDQAVVVGSHYDGEPTSKGSAYDDTSGSMLLLALARAMGDTWRANGLPSRTVIFALFDAEEEGLVGSLAYTFIGAHHAIQPKPVVMVDEEQSGIGYPVRPFGLLSQRPLPSYAVTNGYDPPARLGVPKSAKPAALRQLTIRLQAAEKWVFAGLHAAYSPLKYRGGKAPVFGTGDLSQLQIGPTPLCCSDNAPYQLLGVPTVTFAGEAGYYDSNPPAWSYPFDQPQDTPAALACDTGGSPTPGAALAAALDLPLAMSEAVVNDYAPAKRGSGLSVLSTMPVAGIPTHFTAAGQTGPTWSFGDGAGARGVNVSHTYRRPGTYTLRVAGRALPLKVQRVAPTREFPFGTLRPPLVRRWQPSELDGVPGCP